MGREGVEAGMIRDGEGEGRRDGEGEVLVPICSHSIGITSRCEVMK
jgi:hypothetical protein